MNEIPDLDSLLNSIPESTVDKRGNIRVFLGQDCFATGRLYDLNDGNKWVLWDTVSVPDEYQQYGIGSTLSRKLLQVARSEGAQKAYCKIESLGGLKTVNKLHPNNLIYVNANDYVDANERKPINLSHEEAFQMVDQNGGEANIGVVFDL